MTRDLSSVRPAVDLETLDQLLLDCPDDGTMVLSELDGYLAGLLVSPHPVPEQLWLREVWGGDEEAFPGDPDRCVLLTGLIHARRAEIVGELLKGDQSYSPVFEIDDISDEVLWEIWAEGFTRAMGLGGKDWDKLLDPGDEDLATAAMGLFMYIAIARGIDLAAASLTDEAPPEMIIPYLVETIYRRQKGLPRIVMGPAPDDPEAPMVGLKIGRNSPCPCGSGKKFKKCCGAN